MLRRELNDALWIQISIINLCQVVQKLSEKMASKHCQIKLRCLTFNRTHLWLSIIQRQPDNNDQDYD